jgi:hypothetical protein
MYQVGAEAMLPPREITLSLWSDENVVLAGRRRGRAWPVADPAIPAGADRCPEPLASVQAGYGSMSESCARSRECWRAICSFRYWGLTPPPMAVPTDTSQQRA